MGECHQPIEGDHATVVPSQARSARCEAGPGSWYCHVACQGAPLHTSPQVLRPYQLSRLSGLVPPPSETAGQPTTPTSHLPNTPPPPSASTRPPGTTGGKAGAADAAGLATPPGLAAALRLARYALRRVGVVEGLLHRLATIPETIEMARATGLTMGQVSKDQSW
mgnify:CR=1 FL=1